MKTKTIGLTLAFCFLAGAACFATDPQIGTWKLKAAKSRRFANRENAIGLAVADFNGDSHPDFALFKSQHEANGNRLFVGSDGHWSCIGPTLPPGWPLIAAADFDRGGHPDFLLYNPDTHQTVIGYLNNNVLMNAALGPMLPAGWSLVGR